MRLHRKCEQPGLKSEKRTFKSRKNKKVAKETVHSVTARYADFAKADSRKLKSFKQFPLSDATQRGLQENNFMTPTDIQRESLQYSLTGADVVGAAKTGSGKTLALLIPVLENLWRQSWSRTTDRLGALIINPTRELAFQTFQVLNKIGAHHLFSAALLIGGTDVEFERKRIGMVNIVVCTPGRLLQHMDENSTFSCEQLQILVIDEADRILDLGFSEQMNAILENLPEDRQTLLFSATQTKNVDDLVRLALKEPVYVSVHENAPQATPESLQQARFLTEAFCHLRPGLSLMGLWGTMNQMKRLEVFSKFNSKTSGAAMIATDVASRGLDFTRVDLVLQLDCPANSDDYIHRVGRTARMNARGEAVLVLTPSQEKGAVNCLHSKNIPIIKISVDEKRIMDISRRLQSAVAQYPNMKESAQKSFVAYIRTIYLMRHKDIFDVNTIDFTALARSYGLAVAPRVRFLKRIANKRSQKLQTDAKGRKGEKSIKELVGMMTSATKNEKGTIAAENEEDGNDVEDEEIDLELGTGNSDGKDVLDGFAINQNNAVSDEEADDLLKVTRRDVFGVLPNQETEMLEELATKLKKPVTKHALARKMLRKGVRLNVKTIFTDSGLETVVGRSVGAAVSDDLNLDRFDIDEAKCEMVQIDQTDKAAYKEKQRKWRKKKREKEKEKMKMKARVKEGGAILDLGVEGSNSESESNLSWLPDPDKPKKYDAEWNEIESNTVDDSNMKAGGNDNEGDVKKTAAKRRKRKLLQEEEKRALELLSRI